MTTTNSAAPYATTTARLGVHVATTRHTTRRSAETVARRAITSGRADSAVVWAATGQVAVFGG